MSAALPNPSTPTRLQDLRIVFMGTPDFAATALQHLLHHDCNIVAVYSQPPRPKGRGHQIQLSPVHNLAEKHNIPVYHPLSLKNDSSQNNSLQKHSGAQAEFIAHKADIAVVAAYGLILPKIILDAPRFGCINIHASLLPRWRGASPIQHAIWKGDDESGITIMQMEEGLDTGPMIAKRSVPIHPHSTTQSLHDELAALGGVLCIETLQSLAQNGILTSETQNDALSCYARMLKKDDGIIDWSESAAAIDRQIRALNPWPGVWTMLGDTRIKILQAEPADEEFGAAPGSIIDHLGHISCGHGTGLRLLEIQPANARRMDITSAFNGGYLKTDSMFS